MQQTAPAAAPAESSPEPAIGGLTHDIIQAAFREALKKGVKIAIANLGREDGFFGNNNVKIPVPPSLSTAEKALRAMGEEKLVDDFILRMNRAAEQAVPKVADIFDESIAQMTLEETDVQAERRALQGVVNGKKDAATLYLKKTAQGKLEAKILPIVKKSTDENEVTSTFKNVIEKVGGATSIFGKKSKDLEIDAYVTQKAVDGLFFMIAREEARIRDNPAAQTSELLRKVFGAKW